MENQIQQCSNCLKNFPSDRIDLHEAYCSRNFRKCEVCSVMIDIHYMEDHNKQHDQKKKCSHCGIQIENIGSGHEEVCPEKLVICRYCEQAYQNKSLQNHVLACGNRPTTCNQCQKLIPIRQLQGHLVRCARRIQRRRVREASQEHIPNRRRNGASQHISINKIEYKHHEKSKQKLFIPIPKVKNVIEPQSYKPLISTIPLSVLKAMEQNEQKILPTSSD